MYLMEDVERIIKQMGLPFEPVELQKQDALEAANEGRFAFFYEVGGGKTLVSTISALLWDNAHNIITCPPILLLQWAKWLKEAGETDVEVYANGITDPKYKRNEAQLSAKWVVISHAILRDDFQTILSAFRGKQLTVIIDEGQAIKNPRSKLYKCINTLIAPDRPLLIDTATPTSKPQDTFAYMKLKTPQLYRGMGHWENLHVGEKDFYGTITKYQNLDMLRDNFAIASVKRTKKDLFGNTLTPIYEPIHYPLSPAHQKLYEKLADERLLDLPDGSKIDATQAQALRHAMQQIVMNYGHFSGNPAHVAAGYDLLDSVIEQVDPMDESKSKLAVWTYYQMSSAAVTAYLQEKFGKEAVVAAYGKTNSQYAVKQIMENPKCRIMVAQPSSVGAGLNLHHVCHEMFFAEMSTTPMLVRQAIGRVDRMGQLVRPTIRFGIAQGTVQVALYQQLLNNDELVSKVERTPRTLRQEILGLE